MRNDILHYAKRRLAEHHYAECSYAKRHRSYYANFPVIRYRFSFLNMLTKSGSMFVKKRKAKCRKTVSSSAPMMSVFLRAPLERCEARSRSRCRRGLVIKDKTENISIGARALSAGSSVQPNRSKPLDRYRTASHQDSDALAAAASALG